MGAYLNYKQENAAGVGTKPWIPLNRWDRGDFSLNIIITGTVTMDVEGTLKKLNQDTDSTDIAAGSPSAEDIFAIASATGLTASTALNITDTPLEAIRINQTAGTGSVKLHVMQT